MNDNQPILPPTVVGRVDVGVSYTDHRGRPIVSDAEGCGVYNVSGAGLIAVEVDGRDVTDLNGCFESSLVVVGNAQTSVNVIYGLMEWPGGSLEQVHLPYRGSGFVCTSSLEARVDGLTATFAADRRGLFPFLWEIEGQGTASILRARAYSVRPLDCFDVVDKEALHARSFTAQNSSEVSILASTFEGGRPFEGPVLSHLNKASWITRLPAGTVGVRVRKVYDRFHGRQRARVLVDGRFKGWWYEHKENRNERWGESEFGFAVDRSPTATDVQICIDPPAGAPLWSVGRYDLFALF